MAPAMTAPILQHVFKSASNGTDSTRHLTSHSHEHGEFHTHRNHFLTNLQLIAFAVLFLITVVLFIEFLGRMILWNTEFAFAARMEAAEERKRQEQLARRQVDVEEGSGLQGPWEDAGLLALDGGDKMDTERVVQTREGRLRI